MARTERPNAHLLKVSLYSVRRLLDPTHEDADIKSIRRKTNELLKVNRLSVKGTLLRKTRYLCAYYESNPQFLPTWQQLNLYSNA
jgi:hypothetical protein